MDIMGVAHLTHICVGAGAESSVPKAGSPKCQGAGHSGHI